MAPGACGRTTATKYQLQLPRVSRYAAPVNLHALAQQ